MRLLRLTTVTMLLTIILASCGTSKKMTSQSYETTKTVEPKEKTIEEQAKEIEAQNRLEEALAKQRKLEKQKVLDSINFEGTKRTTEQENRILVGVCEEESYDTDEYMAGLGIAEGKVEQGVAQRVALKAAKAEIMNKFIGAFENGIREYTNDIDTPSGEERNMAKLEGGVKSAGEAAINKYSDIVCRKTLENPVGGYDVYIVVHVSREDVKKEIANHLETMEVNYNEVKFFDYVDKSLDAQKNYKEKQTQDVQNQYEIR